MNASAHRWFQCLQDSYASRLNIQLMQGSEIVQELLYRGAIREMFFPHAVLDVAEFRDTVAKTRRMSTEELAALNAGNIDQYLRRLEAADARFAYAVTYRRNLEPPSAARKVPGLIASISDGTKTIDVFARDAKALKLNPPKAHFTVTGAGVEKMSELIRSGRQQVIEPGELLAYTSDFEFLAPPRGPIQSAKLMIGPAGSALTSRLTRLTFGSGADAVVYECVKLARTRHGQEEAEFESSGALPLRMSLIVRLSGTGSVHFGGSWAGSDVRAVRKLTGALKAMYSSQELEVYDLESSVALLRSHGISGALPDWFSAYDALLDDAVRVADFYEVDLKMPETPTATDLESLALLNCLIDGLPLAAENITCTLIKRANIGDGQEESILGVGSYLLTFPEYSVRPVLFGVPVCTGPVVYQIPRASVENPEAVCRFLRTAAAGEDITLVLRPICPVEARAVRAGNSLPG